MEKVITSSKNNTELNMRLKKANIKSQSIREFTAKYPMILIKKNFDNILFN